MLSISAFKRFYRSVWMGVAWGLVAACLLAFGDVVIQKMAREGHFYSQAYQDGFINGAGFGFALLLTFIMGLFIHKSITANLKADD